MARSYSQTPQKLRPISIVVAPAHCLVLVFGCQLCGAGGNLLVDDCLIIEAKSVEPCDLQRFRMQLLSYMKLLDKPLGLVMNFGEERFGQRGIRRVILKNADAGFDPFKS